MKRIVLAFGLATCGVLAYALGSFGSVFNTTYKVAPGSPLEQAKCSICHLNVRGGKLNPYGLDLQKVMKAANTKKLTADLLHKTDNLASLQAGKNIDRIKAGKNPGIP